MDTLTPSPPLPLAPSLPVPTPSDRVCLDEAQKALRIPVTFRERKCQSKINFPPTEASLPAIIQALRSQETLSKEYFTQLLEAEAAYFTSFPNIPVVRLREGQFLFVVGDLHGCFYELVEIFKQTGLPDSNRLYLFNGDLVDRGCWSCEILLLLLTLSYLRPGTVFINRGNHESDYCTKLYGFQHELAHKYSRRMIQEVLRLFGALPLATKLELPYSIHGAGCSDTSAHVCSHPYSSSSSAGCGDSMRSPGTKRRSIFVVHAGLPVSGGITLGEINRVDRFREPSGMIMEQLLWSDPQSVDGVLPSSRKFSCLFGPDVTRKFLSTNKLDFVIRSHEVTDGHLSYGSHMDRLITIYSTHDSKGCCPNKAEYIRFTGMKPLKKAKNWTYFEIPRARDKPVTPLWMKELYSCTVM